MSEEVKLGIAVPSLGTWHADFGGCVTLMSAYFLTNPPTKPVGYHLMPKSMSHLPMLRTALAKGLIKRGCTHILWLDSDMTFPWDTANRLLAHDLPIVACNYVRKVYPYTPVSIGLDGKHCFSSDDKTGLEEVLQIGMGVMLTHASVFDDFPEPWFPMGWSDKMQSYIGEDVYFCHKQRKLKGNRVFVDHDLSKEVLHVGTFGYNNDSAEFLGNGSRDLQRPDDIDSQLLPSQ